MSLTSSNRLKAGRFVMVDIEGTRLSPEQAQFLQQNHLRAVCLFRKNIESAEQLAALTAQLRDVMGPQALIGLDQEGGAVVRATFVPQPPSAMAIGAVGDEAQAQAIGEAVARALRSLGINWNFAPVLDVNNNPANPVIAERSFSQDPQEVARLAGAWMRGSLNEAVACCVKHFPGHGDTHVDSHLDLPVVDKSPEELAALELLPFRALAPQAPAMMTAHIVYPQVDPEHPATLSPTILGQWLRKDWGYDGVIITDSLVMKAIHERFGHDRAAVMAMQAGADMVMALGSMADQVAAIRALEQALDDGRIGASVAQKAADRLDGLAGQYPVRHDAYAADQAQQDDALMHRAWAGALTAIGQPRPLPPAHRVRVVTQDTVPCDGVSEAGPSAEQVKALFAFRQDVEFVVLPDLKALDSLPASDAYTVWVSNHRDRYAKPVPAGVDLHLVLWNPYQVLDSSAPALVSWGYADGALAAVSQWLAGAMPATGRSPIDLHLRGQS